MKINYTELESICQNSIESFESFGEVTQTKDGIYIHNQRADNKVLAVAHLDFVAQDSPFEVVYTKRDSYVFHNALDDRLGVYAITKLLPSLGLSFDILLTEGEESGRSTAAWFETQKQYNWMFSFDRRGDDVVMYEYDNKETRELLKSFDFYPAIGSFSDICFLEHLNCTGFNFGTGYYMEHTQDHHAKISVFKDQIIKFHKFFNANKDMPMPYEKVYTQKSIVRWSQPSTGVWEDEWYNYDSYCDICALAKDEQKLIEYGGYYICQECINKVGQCASCGELTNETLLIDSICEDCRFWEDSE